MANNPFEVVQALTTKLQEQHDTLIKAIPRLKATKEAASQDLNALNKRVVASQVTLEQLQEQIASATNAYNEWQSGQLAALKTKQADFDKVMAAREADLGLKVDTLSGSYKALEQAQQDLGAAQARLTKDREATDDKLVVNTKWAETLTARETKVKQREAAVDQHSLKQEARAAELSAREAKVVTTEARLTEDVRRSELDKQTAKKLLDDSKESIANNDAKEQELDFRDGFLKKKAMALDRKEAELNDRTGVIATH